MDADCYVNNGVSTRRRLLDFYWLDHTRLRRNALLLAGYVRNLHRLMGLEPCGFTGNTRGCYCPCCGAKLYRDVPITPACGCTETGAAYLTQLTPTHYLWQCRNCNWTLEATDDEPVDHRCGSTGGLKLGDKIETALKDHGITKEKWIAFKVKFHLPPTCNCDARKEWLNNLGDKLGAAAKAAVEKLT